MTKYQFRPKLSQAAAAMAPRLGQKHVDLMPIQYPGSLLGTLETLRNAETMRKVLRELLAELGRKRARSQRAQRTGPVLMSSR